MTDVQELRALLAAAGKEWAEAADALQTEAARLRSDLDIERAQSAEFMKEIERLKAGIADAERWAAHSAAGEAAAIGVIKRAVSDMLRIPVSIEALAVSAIRQSLSDFRPSVAGSRMLDRLHAIEGERDALLAEVERLKARIDAVGRVLSENGCDCDCGCFWDEHGDDCDRCLACRVEDAIARREDVVVEGKK